MDAAAKHVIFIFEKCYLKWIMFKKIGNERYACRLTH